MIRATLLLATALLLGLGGVVWVARDLDPLRVIERFAPAQVRTVDLTGSEAFVRREPAATPAPSGPPVELAESAGVAKSGEVADPAAGTPAPTAVAVEPPAEAPEVVIDVPGLAADVVDFLGASLGSSDAFEEALEPDPDPDVAAEATAGPAAPAAVLAPEPLDPDASAELVRRLLAVYERAGERR